MRLIIAGSRTATRADVLAAIEASNAGEGIAEVVCGDAPGADTEGALWADAKGIPVRHFPADWKRWGKAAGPMRNEEMAQNADALLAIWDGQSKGTAHMIHMARQHGLRIYIHRFTQTGEGPSRTE